MPETNEEIIAYYCNLLIIQYISKPRARATIGALIDPIIMNQLPTQVQDAFDINTAVGKQLDTIGKYTGVSRTGYTFSGQITLTDDEFRLLIKMAIVKNNSGSSLATIQSLLYTYFRDSIRVFDFANMRMGYYISSQYASQNLAQMFIVQGLLPVPMAVQLASTIYTPTLDDFFGFQSYKIQNFKNSPFNTYGEYNESWPWLTYDYEIGSPSNSDNVLITEGGDRITQEDGSIIFI